MFDLYAFGDVCLSILPVVIFGSLILSAVLGHLAARSPSGMQLAISISYILCAGVMVHEAAHRLFCAIFGVKVKETRYFYVDRKHTEEQESVNIGGYVDIEEISSTTTGIFLGLAPLIINGLCVALLYYYGPLLMATVYYPLFVYLGIALSLGARPSGADLKLTTHAFKRAPGRGIFELILLCIVGVLLGYLLSIQANVWVLISVGITCFIIIVMESRKRAGVTRQRFVPRV